MWRLVRQGSISSNSSEMGEYSVDLSDTEATGADRTFFMPMDSKDIAGNYSIKIRYVSFRYTRRIMPKRVMSLRCPSPCFGAKAAQLLE